MAIIGIHCNNNDTEEVRSKIGRIPPFVDGMLNSFSIRERTGIFDFSGDCSTNGQLDYSTGYVTITFLEGFGIVCGRGFYIEEGTTLQIPLTDTATGSIGVKVDLSQNPGSEISLYSKTSQTLTQNDLLENRTTGVYEFEIYRYTVASNVFTLGTKTLEIIQDNKTEFDNLNTNKANKNATAMSSENILAWQTLLGLLKSNNVNLNVNGYIKIPIIGSIEGILIQWGKTNGSPNYQSFANLGLLNFQRVFNCYGTQCADSNNWENIQVTNLNTTGMTIRYGTTNYTTALSFLLIGTYIQ